MEEQKKQGHFERNLGLFDATSIVAGSMIGSGIFIVSADIVRQLHSAWMLLLVWGLVAVTTTVAALCYSEYAASIPEAGGMYVYLKKVWGKRVGFLYGWCLFLVIQTGCIAAVSVAFAKFLGILLPQFVNSNPFFSIGAFKISPIEAIAMGVITTLTYINSRGVQLGAIVQNVFTSTKLVALLGLIVCGVFAFNPHIVQTNFTIPHMHLGFNLLTVIAVATVGAFFSADSWCNVTFIASEIKKPEVNLPRALFFGVGGVCVLYFLINIIYLSVLSLGQIQSAPNDIVAASFFSAIFGNSGKAIISVIIMISAIGAVNGTILSGARAFWAMANDNLFFKSLAYINPETNVPTNALIAQGAWAILLVLSGSFSALLVYITFIELVFYTITIGGLFLFRHKYPDIERPYKTVWYPYLPIFYCAFSIFMGLCLLAYRPENTLPGLLILCTGVPVYYMKIKKAVLTSED
jgi:APA family basic amino acid/polyamine antiporter